MMTEPQRTVRIFFINILFFISLSGIYGQVTAPDCSSAINICTNSSFAVDPNGFGNIDELNGNISNPSINPNGSNMGCLLSGETNSTWMIINIATTGNLEFSFGALSLAGNFFDWILWSYDANTCSGIINNTLPPIRCNWNGIADGLTGIGSVANYSAMGGDPTNFETPLLVTCGDQYIVCLSNYSSATTNVPLNFFGSATVSCQTFTPITVNGDTICEGSCATLTANGGNSYTWTFSPQLSATTGATVQACPPGPGVYSYEVTGTGSCGTGIDTAVVLVLPTSDPACSNPCNVTMTLGVTDETCFGACDGMINSIPAGGTGPGTYTYSWTPAFGNVPLISGLCAGSYSLTVTDNNGCSVTADTVINSPTPLIIDSIVGTDEICGGDCLGTITVYSVGATQYSLNGVNYQTSNIFSNLCTANYVVYVQDANSCVTTQTVTINGPTPVTLQAFSDTTICIGGSAQLNAVASGGVGGFTYAWDSGPMTQNVSVSPLLNQVYCVIGTDQNGCPSVQECVTVSVNPALSVQALSDQSICDGDNANISGSASGGDGGPYTYTWDQGLGIGSNQTVTPTATTIFTVTATDGCETPSATASITITVSPIPAISFLGDTLEGCTPLTVTFTENNVPSGSQCQWDFGDGGASTNCGPVSYTYTTPGCWDVTLDIITPDGCPSSFSEPQFICIYDYPAVSFTFGPQPTTVLNTLISFDNNSLGAANYLWSFDVDVAGNIATSTLENPSFLFPDDQPGNYEVCLIGSNNHGCSSTVCNNVIISEQFLVYVPNAFTPGYADGINDEFMPVLTGIDVLEYEFYVFNRWGEIVFKSTIPGESWNGYFKGVMVSQDAYAWRLVVVDEAFNRSHEFTGHVLLFK